MIDSAEPRGDDVFVAPGADVDVRATIQAGTKIWYLAQVRENACLGRDCVIGRGEVSRRHGV